MFAGTIIPQILHVCLANHIDELLVVPAFFCPQPTLLVAAFHSSLCEEKFVQMLVDNDSWSCNMMGFQTGESICLKSCGLFGRIRPDITNNPWVEQSLTSDFGAPKNPPRTSQRLQPDRESSRNPWERKCWSSPSNESGCSSKMGKHFSICCCWLCLHCYEKETSLGVERNETHHIELVISFAFVFLRQRLVSAMKEFRPDVLLSWLENASKVEPGWPKLDTVYLCALCACLLRNRFIYCIYVYFCLLLLSLEFKISCGHLRILSAYLCICDCMNVGDPSADSSAFLGHAGAGFQTFTMKGTATWGVFLWILQVEAVFSTTKGWYPDLSIKEWIIKFRVRSVPCRSWFAATTYPPLACFHDCTWV